MHLFSNEKTLDSNQKVWKEDKMAYQQDYNNSDDNLVILKAYDNSVLAHMDKNLLEANNIETFIFDENTVGVNPLWNITVGGIKLNVRNIDYPAAYEILRSNQEEIKSTDLGLSCPKCGSKNILTHYHSAKGVKAVFAFIVAFFTTTYPLSTKDVNICDACGHEFNSEKFGN